MRQVMPRCLLLYAVLIVLCAKGDLVCPSGISSADHFAFGVAGNTCFFASKDANFGCGAGSTPVEFAENILDLSHKKTAAEETMIKLLVDQKTNYFASAPFFPYGAISLGGVVVPSQTGSWNLHWDNALDFSVPQSQIDNVKMWTVSSAEVDRNAFAGGRVALVFPSLETALIPWSAFAGRSIPLLCQVGAVQGTGAPTTGKPTSPPTTTGKPTSPPPTTTTPASFPTEPTATSAAPSPPPTPTPTSSSTEQPSPAPTSSSSEEESCATAAAVAIKSALTRTISDWWQKVRTVTLLTHTTNGVQLFDEVVVNLEKPLLPYWYQPYLTLLFRRKGIPSDPSELVENGYAATVSYHLLPSNLTTLKLSRITVFVPEAVVQKAGSYEAIGLLTGNGDIEELQCCASENVKCACDVAIVEIGAAIHDPSTLQRGIVPSISSSYFLFSNGNEEATHVPYNLPLRVAPLTTHIHEIFPGSGLPLPISRDAAAERLLSQVASNDTASEWRFYLLREEDGLGTCQQLALALTEQKKGLQWSRSISVPAILVSGSGNGKQVALELFFPKDVLKASMQKAQSVAEPSVRICHLSWSRTNQLELWEGQEMASSMSIPITPLRISQPSVAVALRKHNETVVCGASLLSLALDAPLIPYVIPKLIVRATRNSDCFTNTQTQISSPYTMSVGFATSTTQFALLVTLSNKDVVEPLPSAHFCVFAQLESGDRVPTHSAPIQLVTALWMETSQSNGNKVNDSDFLNRETTAGISAPSVLTVMAKATGAIDIAPFVAPAVKIAADSKRNSATGGGTSSPSSITTFLKNVAAVDGTVIHFMEINDKANPSEYIAEYSTKCSGTTSSVEEHNSTMKGLSFPLFNGKIFIRNGHQLQVMNSPVVYGLCAAVHYQDGKDSVQWMALGIVLRVLAPFSSEQQDGPAPNCSGVVKNFVGAVAATGDENNLFISPLGWGKAKGVSTNLSNTLTLQLNAGCTTGASMVSVKLVFRRQKGSAEEACGLEGTADGATTIILPFTIFKSDPRRIIEATSPLLVEVGGTSFFSCVSIQKAPGDPLLWAPLPWTITFLSPNDLVKFEFSQGKKCTEGIVWEWSQSYDGLLANVDNQYWQETAPVVVQPFLSTQAELLDGDEFYRANTLKTVYRLSQMWSCTTQLCPRVLAVAGAVEEYLLAAHEKPDEFREMQIDVVGESMIRAEKRSVGSKSGMLVSLPFTGFLALHGKWIAPRPCHVSHGEKYTEKLLSLGACFLIPPSAALAVSLQADPMARIVIPMRLNTTELASFIIIANIRRRPSSSEKLVRIDAIIRDQSGERTMFFPLKAARLLLAAQFPGGEVPAIAEQLDLMQVGLFAVRQELPVVPSCSQQRSNPQLTSYKVQLEENSAHGFVPIAAFFNTESLIAPQQFLACYKLKGSSYWTSLTATALLSESAPEQQGPEQRVDYWSEATASQIDVLRVSDMETVPLPSEFSPGSFYLGTATLLGPVSQVQFYRSDGNPLRCDGTESNSFLGNGFIDKTNQSLVIAASTCQKLIPSKTDAEHYLIRTCVSSEDGNGIFVPSTLRLLSDPHGTSLIDATALILFFVRDANSAAPSTPATMNLDATRIYLRSVVTGYFSAQGSPLQIQSAEEILITALGKRTFLLFIAPSAVSAKAEGQVAAQQQATSMLYDALMNGEIVLLEPANVSSTGITSSKTPSATYFSLYQFAEVYVNNHSETASRPLFVVGSQATRTPKPKTLPPSEAGGRYFGVFLLIVLPVTVGILFFASAGKPKPYEPQDKATVTKPVGKHNETPGQTEMKQVSQEGPSPSPRKPEGSPENKAATLKMEELLQTPQVPNDLKGIACENDTTENPLYSSSSESETEIQVPDSTIHGAGRVRGRSRTGNIPSPKIDSFVANPTGPASPLQQRQPGSAVVASELPVPTSTSEAEETSCTPVQKEDTVPHVESARDDLSELEAKSSRSPQDSKLVVHAPPSPQDSSKKEKRSGLTHVVISRHNAETEQRTVAGREGDDKDPLASSSEDGDMPTVEF